MAAYARARFGGWSVGNDSTAAARARFSGWEVSAAVGGTVVEVPAGALLLTGFAPTVAVTNSHLIAVPQAALTLTAYAPTVAVSVPAAGTTGAVVYLPLRFATGLWGGGVSNTVTARSLLPQQHQQFGYAMVDGKRVPVYLDGAAYRWADFLSNVQVGRETPPLTEIVAAVVATLAQAQAVTATVTAVSQQAQQNAASLTAAVEVIQTAALPGASQIPRPQNHYMEP